MDAITENAEQSYSNLADAIHQFQETGKLSLKVRVEKLECYKKLGESLFENEANLQA